MTRRPFTFLAFLLALGACASFSPEARVREKLIDAGLKPRMAQCVAERLVDRLSTDQLKALAHAASLPHQDVGRMSFDELIHRLEAIRDPEIVAVVTHTGIKCAIHL